jgi:hypothetical protein
MMNSCRLSVWKIKKAGGRWLKQRAEGYKLSCGTVYESKPYFVVGSWTEVTSSMESGGGCTGAVTIE